MKILHKTFGNLRFKKLLVYFINSHDKFIKIEYIKYVFLIKK